MEAMGFREFGESEALSASFDSITVYEARGIILPVETAEVSVGRVAGADYRLAASCSVNDACTALVADVFVDDEADWKKEKKCQGPFILVQLGPTQEHKCTRGRIKIEESGDVTTYDCFPNARTELEQLESRVLPPIISGLTCAFNEEARYVALRKVERAVFGRKASGSAVHDIRFELRGEAYTSYHLANPQLAEKLDIAKNLTSALNPKASRFLALGLAEEDQVKRFLFFFLALEVETHAAFSRINHTASVNELLNAATADRQSVTKLLQTQVDGLKNLYDRFVWCATCAWSNLTEADIAQFKVLKRARDDIAHGAASEPPIGLVLQAELLAHKVLSNAI